MCLYLLVCLVSVPYRLRHKILLSYDEAEPRKTDREKVRSLLHCLAWSLAYRFLSRAHTCTVWEKCRKLIPRAGKV